MARILKLSKPDEHIVLPEMISIDGLAPAIRKGDEQWYDIVSWVHYATVLAEELGITTATVDSELKSANPTVRTLLGLEGSLGNNLELRNDWGYRVVKNVGNYGEIFERNVGHLALMKMDRGPNALVSKGGLQQAPPLR